MFDESLTWECSCPASLLTPSDAAGFAAQLNDNGFDLKKAGIRMPALGLGTWLIPNSQDSVQLISCAIESGYRMIDTAALYGNERCVGAGIRMSGIDRSEIFVTTKVRNEMRGYQKTMDAFFKSMNELDLDYIDLFLVHWPANAANYDNWDELNRSGWKAMIELYEEGYVRAIGVSNFLPHHLQSLLESRVPPMVNQIEFHPGYTQQHVLDYCNRYGIVVQGWSPFGRGRVLTHPVLQGIADKYGKTAAQICLRYALQHNVQPLPKTIRPERMVENMQIFDFVLDDGDMRALDAMAEENIGYSGLDPDKMV